MKSINNEDEKDLFSNEVIAALEKKNLTVDPRFKFSSIELDILIKKGNQFIGIDLVVYPREISEAFNLERYSMLNRAGFKT